MKVTPYSKAKLQEFTSLDGALQTQDLARFYYQQARRSYERGYWFAAVAHQLTAEVWSLHTRLSLGIKD